MIRTRTRIGAAGDPPALAGTAVAALRGVRLPSGAVGDVLLDGGHVADAPGPGVELDAAGWRALPAAAEPHAHLDKALTAPRADPGSGNDLLAACLAWGALLPTVTRADVRARALAAVRRHVAGGTTAIRTHVDLPPDDDPLRGVEALVALREELRGVVDLQVCLLPGSLAPDAEIERAVAAGVDVMGGCPHLAADPHAELTRILDVAQRHDLPVDVHADEQTDVGDHLDVVDLAEQVLARGLTRPVTASHCVRLGSLPPDRLAPVLALLARARVGVVTLPITNLYLQGRDAEHSPPRGLAALRALLDAGVPLAAGADNLRDPFNPVGRADPFETTSLLVTAGHLRPEEALHAVTAGARRVMGLPPAGVHPGDAADLVLVPDGDLGDVLAGAVDARVVLHAGRVVADTRTARALVPALDPARPVPAPVVPAPAFLEVR